MRILIHTQYYPPETGAPQNRLSGMARELMKEGHEVVILTAMPNYPAMEVHSKYRGVKYVEDSFDGIPVFRTWIYVSKNRSIISRLLNYFSFTFSSMWYHRRIKGSFDALICESPPLFLGISSWWIAKRKKAKLIFNVSDLWPESAEKLGVISNKFALGLATKLEEFLYRNSFMITGQTQGIVKNIKNRFPDKSVHWLPNGVDESIFTADEDKNWRTQLGFNDDDVLMLYAGIIGIAQGLDILLDAARLLPQESKIKILLMGEGPEKERLLSRKQQEDIHQVYFLPLTARNKIPSIVKSIDAAVIPLKKMDLFLGAIPSKIFENLALGKPILLAVDGEARTLFIEQGKSGLFVPPENSKAMADAMLKLERDPALRKELGENGVNYVKEHFLRKNITRSWLAAFKQLTIQRTL